MIRHHLRAYIGLAAAWLAVAATPACKAPGDADTNPPPLSTSATPHAANEQPADTATGNPTDSPAPHTADSLADAQSAPAPDALSPGLHAQAGGAALVFAVGMPRAEAEATLRQVVQSGRARVTLNKREQKTNQGTTADVHAYELTFSDGQSVASVLLTLFSDTLVAVTTTYRAPDPKRLSDLTDLYGPPQTTEHWHGWWDPTQDVILQLSTDTLRHEVFSLAAARPITPGVGPLMQKSWLQRYGAPPPWVSLPPP
jgi:hypothetical protein